MKFKIIILLLTAIACGALNKTYAQTEIQAGTKTYSEVFDSLSTGLIPSRIPYGILYNRVYGWGGLDNWNNADTTSISKLYQGWYDAEQSYISTSLRPNRYENMRSKVQQQIYQVQLPIVALCYQYSYIDSNALVDGRMTINNGMLTDNNAATPYLTKQIGMVGFGLDKVATNKNYAIQLDTALLFINNGSSISQVIINNITTGLQYTAIANAGQLIQFTQVGKNVLKFTINTNTGLSYIAYQNITVEANNNVGILYRPNGPSCDPTNDIIESTIPFKGYTETVATNSFADYHIYYHTINLNGINNCERILKKPIIIMDGFDPLDKNKYFNIYDDYLSYGFPKIRLGDDLRDKGYDVIILNFPKLGSTINGAVGVPNKVVPSLVKVNGTSAMIDKTNRDGGTD